MIPIQDLYNKIRWDKEFGKGHFEIGYEEHWEEKIIRIPFKKIIFEEGNHFSFQIKQGLMVEVHHEPTRALSDGPQAPLPIQFEELVRGILPFLTESQRAEAAPRAKVSVAGRRG